jgi:serralysin
VSEAQRINLEAETSSNVAGYVGNMSIARGTIIENATGGSGADTIAANSVVNTLYGLGGKQHPRRPFWRGSHERRCRKRHLLCRQFRRQGHRRERHVGVSVVSQLDENIVLLGTGSISAIGNNLANTITGNSGNNRIDGRGGIDVMTGGSGSDTYYVDNALDKTIEANVVGTDTVYTTVSKAFVDQFVEVIRLAGSANINTTGNGLANTIVGNGANNAMNGREGADVMTGGYGHDSFVFNTALGGRQHRQDHRLQARRRRDRAGQCDLHHPRPWRPFGQCLPLQRHGPGAGRRRPQHLRNRHRPSLLRLERQRRRRQRPVRRSRFCTHKQDSHRCRS